MSDYTTRIEQDEDGVFVACCPELPGCVSQGASREEAEANLEEARQGYLECLARCNERVPPACRLDEEDGGRGE
jgi:antitoxin HicB